MPSGPTDLTGLRILVIEDNFLVAESIRDALDSCGCEVIGPAPDVETGVPLAESANLDGALLDVNLGGEYCFPIAKALRLRGVPFLFLTGYDDSSIIPPDLRSVRRLSKPFDTDELAAIARVHFTRAGDQPPADKLPAK